MEFNHPESSHPVEGIVKEMKEQILKYQQLIDLCQTERQLLEADKLEQAVAILESKQKLMVEIEESQRRVTPLMDSIERGEITDERILQEGKTLAKVLMDALELERQNGQMLLDKMQAVREKMAKTRQEKKVKKAYLVASSKAKRDIPRFMDRKK